ncbi:MAG TPA: hypothetical protein VFA90_04255 [Terriglobales bacterium]|nr:hypothetical protein [Terriglobales bacterium]
MGVTTELHNIGDTNLSREIVARIEHAFADKPGAWHVSITGSRETDNWELKLQGPNGFERSYTMSGAAGEHGPDAILRIILQLAS